MIATKCEKRGTRHWRRRPKGRASVQSLRNASRLNSRPIYSHISRCGSKVTPPPQPPLLSRRAVLQDPASILAGWPEFPPASLISRKSRQACARWVAVSSVARWCQLQIRNSLMDSPLRQRNPGLHDRRNTTSCPRSNPATQSPRSSCYRLCFRLSPPREAAADAQQPDGVALAVAGTWTP